MNYFMELECIFGTARLLSFLFYNCKACFLVSGCGRVELLFALLVAQINF